MREAFEKWMSDNGKWPKAIEKNNGAYVLMQTASAWEAWRAAWLECQIATAKTNSKDIPQTHDAAGWEGSGYPSY